MKGMMSGEEKLIICQNSRKKKFMKEVESEDNQQKDNKVCLIGIEVFKIRSSTT